MSVFNGEKLKIEITGGSHDEEIKLVAEGFPTVKYDESSLKSFLKRRMPTAESYSTQRREEDEPIFVKGLDNGLIGGLIEVIIKNNDVKKSDYNALYAKPRPSHSDLAAFYKDGTLDFSGGGRFSGRMTAPLCVAGYFAKTALKSYGIEIGSYISSVGNVFGKSYKTDEITYFEIENNEGFPSLSNEQNMLDKISSARADKDSIGATAECIIFNLPKGVGDNLFGGIENKISNLIFAIPGVKGIEFGRGFEISELFGSEANDEIYIKSGEILTKTNNSGGINGGISNGMNVNFRVAFRPTPSIGKTQNTVDLEKTENTTIEICGRHDACFAVRALPAVESAAAIAILDIMLYENRLK